MAKKIVNSDIYNLSKLVDDVKSVFIPDETEETLAISTYGYLGAIESHRLQTQVQMTGELCNEVFPSRSRLDRNVITHAIMTNIADINAIPAKMTAFLAIRESDIENYFNEQGIFLIDRNCPIYVGDFEFHLDYDIELKRVNIKKKATNAYAAQYIIPNDRDVPNSSIKDSNRYLAPPAVVMVENEAYVYLTVALRQVEHMVVSKKLVTSNIVDNKTINFEFENQLAYFEIHCKEPDNDYYVTPVFEGSSVPESNSKYYCWYQYIDTNLIRVRFDRKSYMPGLNAVVECLVKTCQGEKGNFTYTKDSLVELESKKTKKIVDDNTTINYIPYSGVTCLLTPITNSAFGKDKKSKRELQSLIPKEALARGCLTTITDLNNYFGMLDSELGRIIIQKKIDNQIERVYYAYFIAKDMNGDVMPSNTVDIEVGIKDLIESNINETDSARFLLQHGKCFHLCKDGIARIVDKPILNEGWRLNPEAVKRGEIVKIDFTVRVNEESVDVDQVSCGVDLSGSHTRTHVFPALGYDRYYAEDPYIGPTIVEDYLQMGYGRSYIYMAEYITKVDNSMITAQDFGLECFDLEDAYCTIDGKSTHFKDQPIITYGHPKNTKIIFSIVNKLNINTKGIITFTYGDKIHKLHQSWKTKLSTILKGLGFLGDVKVAISQNEDIVTLTENGLIPGTKPEPEKPDVPEVDPDKPPVEITDPFKKKVVNNDVLPSVEERKKNEWYWIIKDKELLPSDNTIQNVESIIKKDGEIPKDPFILHVLSEKDLPPIEERKKNEWYYVVTDIENANSPELYHFAGMSNTYRVHVVLEEDLPPIDQRGTDEDWYLVVTKSVEIGEAPDPKPDPDPDPDPPAPPSPTTLSGKDYDVEILRNFENETAVISVTIGEEIYNINLTQDLFNLENTITVTEDRKEVSKTSYLTYVPVLEQDKWPDDLIIGDLIHYTLKYKSCSNSYRPEVTIELSRGLELVPYSTYITYPGKDPIQVEPIEVSLINKRGFLYTNPYAISVNGYRLYSAFYMMSLNENPYLHFEWINDKSDVQFIATNIKWDRDFYSDDNSYTMSVSITQSIQENIGLINENDPDAMPLVKAVAVFFRDGKPYRYRSLRLTDFDPSSFTFNFSQKFYSEDIFDNDNNIKITNAQIIGQSEFKTVLEYNGKTYTIRNGGSVKLSNLVGALGISLSDVHDVVSSDPYSIDAYPIMNGRNVMDYDIISFADLINPGTITISQRSNPMESDNIVINVSSIGTAKKVDYGYYNPKSEVKIYTLCKIPTYEGHIQYNFDSICPDYKDELSNKSNWTVTNILDVVGGVTFYHNYSEIMGSRVVPYGKKYIDENNNTVMKLEGFRIKSIPMLGYDYCRNELLVQNAINALNYRKAYIDNAMIKLENSFGIDFKLFNTYGPSKTYYILRDIDKNGLLDNNIEFIDRVNISLFFRTKLVASNDFYTKNNIINEIKEYIEDLDDLGQLHIPNLVTQITTNYKEQISYFEYLGFNNYGAEIQHIYKVDDDEIPIHTAPEFLCINNSIEMDGETSPDINIYISEF